MYIKTCGLLITQSSICTLVPVALQTVGSGEQNWKESCPQTHNMSC